MSGRSPPSFAASFGSFKSSGPDKHPPPTSQQIKARINTFMSDTESTDRTSARRFTDRIEQSVATLQALKKKQENAVVLGKTDAKKEAAIGHSRSVALLAGVNQLLRDCKNEENRQWERDYRRRSNAFKAAVEDTERTQQRDTRDSDVDEKKKSLEPIAVSEPINSGSEGPKMSRWPTVTSLSSPQAQMTGKVLFPDTRLLSSLQKELKLTQLRLDSRETELLSVKLALESTEHRLERIELKMNCKEEGNEEFEEERSERGSQPHSVHYFEQLYRLKNERKEAKMRTAAKDHRDWIRALQSSLTSLTVLP